MLSLVAFIGVSIYVSMRNIQHGSFVPRFNALLMEEAIEAWQTGGQPALAAHMQRVARQIPGSHYLTDAAGKDLATGEDRSRLLAMARPDTGPPKRFENRQVVMYPSPDGKYRFLVVFENYFDLSQYLPYYLLILAAVALLCWILATNLASPLRGLARVVDRFGAGDLSVRVNSSRKDEIGEVGRAFDRMAERIGTLLTAERRLLQDISHELRSPLARLSFAAELARTADDRDAAIARMKKEIARLTDLVGGLIQVTRAEGDPAASSSESLRLDELLGEVVDDCRVEADARGCRIAFDGEPRTHHARRSRSAPPRRRERAAQRHPLHPRRHQRRCPTRRHRRHRAHQRARLRPRRAAEALPKIFQPFFRVDDSRYTATGGVGLGLAIASRAIGLHHGKLWAENTAPA